MTSRGTGPAGRWAFSNVVDNSDPGSTPPGSLAVTAGSGDTARRVYRRAEIVARELIRFADVHATASASWTATAAAAASDLVPKAFAKAPPAVQYSYPRACSVSLASSSRTRYDSDIPLGIRRLPPRRVLNGR